MSENGPGVVYEVYQKEIRSNTRDVVVGSENLGH